MFGFRTRTCTRSRADRPARARIVACTAALLAALLGLTACGAPKPNASIVVAIVSNPQMQDAISLQDQFKQAHPGIDVKFVSLPENEARAKITASVATKSGEFDVVMISNYETKMWAQNGWITDLQRLADKTEGYDTNDFIPTVRKSLSYRDDMYSVPFYGEGAFLAYRKDLAKAAGITMPARPTWDQIRQYAKKMNDKAKGISGVCMRGLAGWGENGSSITAAIHGYGGKWFDDNWNPQLESPEARAAVTDYVNLVRDYGEPGAATAGYSDCLTLMSQGNVAMWPDSTAMVSSLEDPKSSKVAGKLGYVQAPVKETKSYGWLYTWSLAIPTTSRNTQAAWDFVSWMTDKDYMKLVGDKLGWERLPPGSRLSTYKLPQYAKIARAYARPTLTAMNDATTANAVKGKVPYGGLQNVEIPEYQDLGTRFGQQMSAAIAGQQSVDDALKQSQQFAETVATTYRKEAGGALRAPAGSANDAGSTGSTAQGGH